MHCELLQVALTVRDQTEREPVRPEGDESGHGIVVEVEVGMNLPSTDHLCRAPAEAGAGAAHPSHYLLGESDPGLLVVHEFCISLHLIDRRESCGLVAVRVELEAVLCADVPVCLGAELRAGPRKREVDVEQHSAQHPPRIARTEAWAPSRHEQSTARGRSRARPGGRPAMPNPCHAAKEGAGGGTTGSPALIGVPRFELGTSPTRTERATRLRHTPSADRVPVGRLPRDAHERAAS